MVTITRADFSDPQLRTFLEAHLADLAPTAPPESRHALDYASLQRPGTRVWTALMGDQLAGTIALTHVEPWHEELKSMRTDPLMRGRGIGARLLTSALDDARARGIRRVSLETGSMEFFEAARHLYARTGFVVTEPFGDYAEDPNSVYMTVELAEEHVGGRR
ncbi:GNAT family N-acetyltransferase [Microbacterium halotolerans]|uniref:GNAT family N-acetyltransferase n=1 Tax=Microbacterium halotolerans TaxID=246613 RepID=UPI000E6AB584|nr:GNAT family N-acetyltransferase [Microbacterium halotolerans]